MSNETTQWMTAATQAAADLRNRLRTIRDTQPACSARAEAAISDVQRVIDILAAAPRVLSDYWDVADEYPDAQANAEASAATTFMCSTVSHTASTGRNTLFAVGAVAVVGGILIWSYRRDKRRR